MILALSDSVTKKVLKPTIFFFFFNINHQRYNMYIVLKNRSFSQWMLSTLVVKRIKITIIMITEITIE